jgi:rhodanese-related sulfurtransferase
MTRNKPRSAYFASLLCFVLAFSGAILKRANLERPQSGASFRTLSAEELLTKVQGRQPVFLVDCRPAEEYCAGHIPGAANVSMDSFSFGKDTVLKKAIEDIQKHIGKTLSFVLIDAESQEEYMPRAKIEELTNHLPKDRNQEVIFYCRRPDCTRSPMAIRWAAVLGYRNVWRYEGGWQEWSQKCYPVEK